MSKKLVVVGNGMAGMACVDAILKKNPDFQITVLSEEPYYNYNRILLSSVLAGDKKVDDIYINTREWYEENQINLHLATKAVDVNPQEKFVLTDKDERIPYDLLLLATGSNPFMPPMEGRDKENVFVFRNIADCEGMIRNSGKGKKAVVIGGGLLGLEAARGVSLRGVETTVVHLMDHLMEMQLDPTGAYFLKRGIEKLGINVRLKTLTTKILGKDQVEGVEFKDGSKLEADMVIVACGIRPNVELAQKAGLTIQKGIVVNDHMETSDPSIFAVGECVEHRGKVYGLVAPLWDQGKILDETITGNKGPTYEGSVLATKLKVAAVDVFSAGTFEATDPEMQAVSYQDESGGIYKKILIQDDQVIGAVLVGDSGDANRFLELIRKKNPLKKMRRASSLVALTLFKDPVKM